MKHEDRRRFTRIDVQLDVHLDFGIRKYRHVASNLSLNGIYVTGLYDQRAGDACIITLINPKSVRNAGIRAVGSVVRISSTGMAVKFISMKIESFLMLQAILFSFAEDPVVLESEPVNGISFAQEDGLIFYDDALPLKNYSFPTA
ncbi:MAG: PilZ domain-containing protein [Candidatus Electrothrix sp. YB6]